MGVNTYLEEFAPVLALHRLMGGLVFTQEFNEQTGRYSVKIKWISWTTLYTLIMCGLQSALVFNTLRHAIQNFDCVDDDLKIHAVIFTMGVVGPYAVPILVFIQHPRINHMFESWYYLEQNLRFVLRPSGPFEFGIRSRTKLSIVFTIVLGSGIVLLFPCLVGKPPDLVDLLLALGTFYRSMLYTVFHNFCQAVSNSSAKTLAGLQDLLVKQNYLPNKLKKHNDEIFEKNVLSYRKLWMDLINVTQETGTSIYLSMGCAILINFELGLYTSYMLCTTILEIGWDGLLFFLILTVVSWIGIFIMCFSAQCLHIQMTGFLSRIMTNFNEINFEGYFKIGTGLMTTLVATSITNLVVLVQLKLRASPIKGVEDLFEIKYMLFGQKET